MLRLSNNKKQLVIMVIDVMDIDVKGQKEICIFLYLFVNLLKI